MAPIEIGIVVVLCLWTVIAVALAIVINNCLKPENRGIYPHPVVGLIIDNQTDYRIGPAAKIWTPILFTILLLPITIECFIFWGSYRVGSYLFNKSMSKEDKKSIQIEPPKYEPEVKEEALNSEDVKEWEKVPEDIIITEEAKVEKKEEALPSVEDDEESEEDKEMID